MAIAAIRETLSQLSFLPEFILEKKNMYVENICKIYALDVVKVVNGNQIRFTVRQCTFMTK